MNTPKLPEFKVNASKNGYEIRTEILAMAKDVVQADFNYKFAGWEMSNARDDKGNVITTIEMPTFPGLDTILDTAEKMYAFVSRGSINNDLPLPKVVKTSNKYA